MMLNTGADHAKFSLNMVGYFFNIPIPIPIPIYTNSAIENILKTFHYFLICKKKNQSNYTYMVYPSHCNPP